VTYTAKVCAAIALILLNLFFMYFIILRGAEKGYSWQWSYVMGCIFQLLTDGLLYETLECFWIHFVIPLLAIEDVRRAVATLEAEVSKLLSAVDDDGFDIDSSEYFHMSYRLAKAFPDLWESVVVRSYHTTQPPIHLSHDASSEASNDTILGSRLLSSLLRRTVVVAGTMMLYFGTINIRIQKMVITVSQPLILAGICWMYYEAAHAKWIVIFPCVGLAILFYYQFRRFSKTGSNGHGKIGIDSEEDANGSSRRRDESSRPHADCSDDNEEEGSVQRAEPCSDWNEFQHSVSYGFDAVSQDEIRGVNSASTFAVPVKLTQTAAPDHMRINCSDGDDDDSSEFDAIANLRDYDSSGSASGRHEVDLSGSRPVADVPCDDVDVELTEDGGGYDEGWWDVQNAWDVEMPDHISLVSDEDGDCHAEWTSHPMTTESLFNIGKDKRRGTETEGGQTGDVGLEKVGSIATARSDSGERDMRDVTETDEEQTERERLMMIDELLCRHISSLSRGGPVATEVSAMYGHDVNVLLDMATRPSKADSKKEEDQDQDTEDPEEVEFNKAFEDLLNSY
jgi:hypothetical protein